MDDPIILLFLILMAICFLFRVLFALFYPDKFAEGARSNLFLKERAEALFPGKDAEDKEWME